MKKKIVRYSLGSLLLVCMLVFSSYRLSYASWVEDEDGIHYKDEEGEFVTGFQTIDEDVYYFDGDGALVTGKFYSEEKGCYYYSDEEGKIGVGVIDDGNHFFVTDDTGKLKTGFVIYNDQKYFFDAAANLMTGWFKSEDDWYYADDSGCVMTGFVYLDGYRYYLNEQGIRISDTTMEIEGITYIFNKDGSIDENATALYPVFCYINERRVDLGKSELSMNLKVQACALKRASSLVNGYTLNEEESSVEIMLNNRGVSCKGGYEFSYGGVEGYSLENLYGNLKQDERFLEMLMDDEITEIGMGVYTLEDISYYDVIVIKK